MILRLCVLAASVVGVLASASCDRTPPVAATPPSREVLVFAAASLTESFTAMAKAFEGTTPGAMVTCSFGASNQLRMQIENGAAALVFASADAAQMDAAVSARIVNAKAVSMLCGNELAIVVPTGDPGSVRSLADLGRKGVRVVVAGAGVPAGAYTLEMLAGAEGAGGELGAGFKDRVMGSNVRSQEENVRAVLAKVELGEADAGVVYRTDALSAKKKGTVQIVEIPAALNKRAEYRIAVTARAEGDATAEAFVAFALSERGQRIMAEHGFITLETGKTPAAGPAPR